MEINAPTVLALVLAGLRTLPVYEAPDLLIEDLRNFRKLAVPLH